MTSGYRELERVTADLGLEAWGPDLARALGQMTRGLASFLSETSLLSGAQYRAVSVSAHDVSGLIVRYLNEIIYMADAEDFLPKMAEDIRIEGLSLEAVVRGETFDPSRHRRVKAVKAATYHGLEVVEDQGEARIRVIFDV